MPKLVLLKKRFFLFYFFSCQKSNISLVTRTNLYHVWSVCGDAFTTHSFSLFFLLPSFSSPFSSSSSSLFFLFSLLFVLFFLLPLLPFLSSSSSSSPFSFPSSFPFSAFSTSSSFYSAYFSSSFYSAYFSSSSSSLFLSLLPLSLFFFFSNHKKKTPATYSEARLKKIPALSKENYFLKLISNL